METTTRYLGNCQICEGDFKLHNSRMVHHGYTRPGHGYIVGDCFGVEEVPYETSCDAIKSWKANLETDLVHQKGYLARLKSGEITTFSRMEGYRHNAKVVEYKKESTPESKWNELLRHNIWEAESNIAMTERVIDRCAKRITEWKPMPIRTIEEEKAKLEAEKAERAKVVAEKRAVKQAKLAATRAKQEALAAKRQAIMDDFANKFRALAAKEITPEVKAEARALAIESMKAKYSFFWARELKIDDALITLGLARRDDGNPLWVHYSGSF